MWGFIPPFSSDKGCAVIGFNQSKWNPSRFVRLRSSCNSAGSWLRVPHGHTSKTLSERRCSTTTSCKLSDSICPEHPHHICAFWNIPNNLKTRLSTQDLANVSVFLKTKNKPSHEGGTWKSSQLQPPPEGNCVSYMWTRESVSLRSAGTVPACPEPLTRVASGCNISSDRKALCWLLAAPLRCLGGSRWCRMPIPSCQQRPIKQNVHVITMCSTWERAQEKKKDTS